jgi:lysophospholipase L1-like esterase
VRRFLALGDSYTIGEGVTEVERWPNQLAQMLRAQAIDISDPHIVARTAWTTDELSDAIDDEKPKGPYHLVTLLVGVNDQYRSRPVQAFETEFAVLLRRAKRLAGNKAARTIAISIPDWGTTPFAEGRDRARISGEIDAYNRRAAALSADAGVRWVDITVMSGEMQTNPVLVAVDGLHPSGELYRRWAAAILPIALSVL